MTLWRLEWLRLWRTRRVVAVAGVFILFGFIGPISAYYLPRLVAHAGDGIQVIVPPAVPPDGITAYLHNSLQLGALVAVIVAAASLTLDARPPLAIFYRTRVLRPAQLMLTRYVPVTLVTMAAFVAGTMVAWYETDVVLGAIHPVRLLIGVALELPYLAFVTAVVAGATAVVRGTLATIGVGLGTIILLPIASAFDVVARWSPSSLADSLDASVRGEAIHVYSGPMAVTLVATVGLLALACVKANTREL